MWGRRAVVFVLSIAFGAFDVRLSHHDQASFWVSNMSALWLLLAFTAGGIERAPARAAAIGLIVTTAALLAFYAPSIGSLAQAHDVVIRYHRYFLGGLVTGPVFGVLGQRWSARRWWPGGLAVAAAFALEPLAWRHHMGFLPSPTYVWTLEVIAGFCLAAWFLLQARRHAAPGTMTP